MGSSAQVQNVVEHLSSHDPRCRQEALRQLHDKVRPEALEPPVGVIVKCLDDVNEDVRSAAFRLLSKKVRPEALEPHVGAIVKCLDDVNEELRSKALWLLYDKVRPEALHPHVGAIVKYLDDVNKDVRSAASWLLGCITRPEALEPHVGAILKCLADTCPNEVPTQANRDVRKAAWHLLETMFMHIDTILSSLRATCSPLANKEAIAKVLVRMAQSQHQQGRLPVPGLINTLACALELDPEFSEAREALQEAVKQGFKWKVPQPPADLAPRAAGAGTGDGDLLSDTPPTPNLSNIETSPVPPEVEERSLAWEMLQHDVKEANKRRYKDSLAYRALELTQATYENNLTDWRELQIKTKVDDRVIFGEPEIGNYGIEIGVRGSLLDLKHLGHWLGQFGNTKYKLVPFRCWTDKSHLAGAMVHDGYEKAYAGMRDAIDEAVSAALARSGGTLKGVLVAGHSRGAGLATLCAADLASRYPGIPFDLVTFASPRTGDWSFARSCEKKLKNLRVARLVNRFDPVPMMPSGWDMKDFKTEAIVFDKRISESHFVHLGEAVVLNKWAARSRRVSLGFLFEEHKMLLHAQNLLNCFKEDRCRMVTLHPKLQSFEAGADDMLFEAIQDAKKEILSAISELDKKMNKARAKDVMQRLVSETKTLSQNLSHLQCTTKTLEEIQKKLPEVNLTNLRTLVYHVLQKVKDFDTRVDREALCAHVLHALCILAQAHLKLNEPDLVLSVGNDLVRGYDRISTMFIELVAEVLQAKAKEENLTRAEFQGFFQACKWPEREGSRPSPVITLLQHLHGCMIIARVKSPVEVPRPRVLIHVAKSLKPHGYVSSSCNNVVWTDDWTCVAPCSPDWRVISVIDIAGSRYTGTFDWATADGDGSVDYMEAGELVYSYTGTFKNEDLVDGEFVLSDGRKGVVAAGVWTMRD